MIIPKITNFNVLRSFRGEESTRQNNYSANFGLKMSEPLKHDTVSFKAAAASNKAMGNIKDAISHDLALKIRKKVAPSHNEFVKLMYETFGDIMSTSENKGLLTYKERIKTAFSIRQKTTSTNEELKDISGNAFILDDAKAFQQFISRFIKLIEKGRVNVVDLEYYRLSPVYKRGKVVESFDSLNASYINKLGEAVDKAKNNVKPILDEKPSPAGYSGMHITVKHPDGNYTEVQVMTRAMWNFKEVENLFYKMKEGKSLDPKYSYVEKILEKLKPVSEFAPEKEKKQYDVFKKKLKQYTIEAYKERLKRPYDDRRIFLRPSDIGLNELDEFDFNKIDAIRRACIDMRQKPKKNSKNH